MKTMEMIIAKLDTIRDDSYYFVNDKSVNLTINDFEGFDDDWSEVEREFVDEDAVMDVLDWLEENADRTEGDYYHDYYFGDIVVTVGYSSFDI